MGVQLRGTGRVLNSGGQQTGTYSARPYSGFDYDDTTQNNNDKSFDWKELKETYYSPKGKDPDDALEMVVCTCEEVDEYEKCKKWSWRSYARNNKDDPWPSQPTSTGTCEKD